MTTQTVKEAVYYSAQLQLPDSMPASEKERAETTIREKGLQDAINTRIGGGGKKGLSGWQKRRVSICIEILTQRRLLFLDEPTSGLDSAASYHVMSRIIDLAQQNKTTVIASIHQPSSEAFELFHNLYLLSSGRTIYFGPASAANEFYAVNGFPCPSLGNPSDHFLRTINKDFDQDIEHGPSAKSISPIEVIEILENSYKSSHICHQVADRVAEISEMGGGALEKGSQASFINQSLILTRRSFVNMYRDVGYYWLRLGMDILICLCGGAIFYIIGYIYESIQVFHRERLNGHYGVVTYVIGNTLSSMPFLFLISVIPGAIAYYSIGLRKGFDHFVYFAMVSFGCTMLVESLMMILASIVPNFLMGRITGAGIQGIMILNSGFARFPNDLRKPVWRYPMYYISFHKYAVQGFCKNEYSGLKFSHSAAGGARIIDDEDVLRTKWQVELGYNKWVNLAISFGMKIIYRLLFLVIMKTIKKVNPMLKALFSVAPKQATQVSERPSTPIQPLF